FEEVERHRTQRGAGDVEDVDRGSAGGVRQRVPQVVGVLVLTVGEECERFGRARAAGGGRGSGNDRQGAGAVVVHGRQQRRADRQIEIALFKGCAGNADEDRFVRKQRRVQGRGAIGPLRLAAAGDLVAVTTVEDPDNRRKEGTRGR